MDKPTFFLTLACCLLLSMTVAFRNDDGLSEHFLDILQVPVPFSTEDDEKKCKTILDQLSDEELQVAARTSYAYWHLEQSGNCPPISLQQASAMREVRRHLVASNGNVRKTMDRLQEACTYRKEHQIDSLRQSFDDSTTASQVEEKTKEQVVGDMEKQPVVMKGNDQDFRAVLVKFPRRADGVTEEEYLITQLYIAERAMACTEFISRGRQETLVAVFDFSTSASSNSPPLKWQLSAIRTIQHLYPERLHKLIIFDPPFWMRGLFIGIRPFLSGDTKDKIQIVTDRSKLFEELDAGREGSSDLENHLLSPVDMHHYLTKVPFYCPYNCKDYLSKK